MEQGIHPYAYLILVPTIGSMLFSSQISEKTEEKELKLNLKKPAMEPSIILLEPVERKGRKRPKRFIYIVLAPCKFPRGCKKCALHNIPVWG